MSEANDLMTLLDAEFQQCREALIESRKGLGIVVPECFSNGGMVTIICDENQTWQIGGWVKRGEWINLFITLRQDNSEDRYLNGERI